MEGGSSQSVLTDIHTYENCKKKYEMTNKLQFKEGALTFELHTGHVVHRILSSINKSGDERVSEQDLEKSSTELWRDTGLFLSIRISSQMQATS